MPPRAFPTISSLEIYTDEGQEIGNNQQLASTSTRYMEVERCIHLALCILESPDGSDSLAKVAIRIIEKSRKNRKPTLYQGNFSDMPRWIKFFLTTMRNSFPMTYLSHMQGEALACRQANDIQSLSDFSPKHIGYMDINRYMVNNMIAAQQRADTKNLKLFRFELIISIAHEIVHFLTGFLNGEKADKMITPPGVGAKGYTTSTRGEAGRLWEELLLGGQTELWKNAADPAGVRQAGIPYLFDDGTSKSKARIINSGYIDNFIAGACKFPIRTESREETTREALRRSSQTMSDVRWAAASGAPRASSPPGAANRQGPSNHGSTNGNSGTGSSISNTKGLRKVTR